jgi:spore maturation protein SpmB
MLAPNGFYSLRQLSSAGILEVLIDSMNTFGYDSLTASQIHSIFNNGARVRFIEIYFGSMASKLARYVTMLVLV